MAHLYKIIMFIGVLPLAVVAFICSIVLYRFPDLGPWLGVGVFGFGLLWILWGGRRLIHSALGEIEQRIHKENEEKASRSIQGMIDEIVELMDSQRQKIRMEEELETAKYMQETFFPPRYHTLGRVTIAAYSGSASECRGDWWHYAVINGKVYLMIGDATGHGMPAALVTAAAKSAVTVLSSMPNITPRRVLEFLNETVFENSKGGIKMTFFVACLDEDSGKLTYANASHEPTFLYQNIGAEGEAMSPLMANVGPRLGESLESQFSESEVELSPGDTLALYTDGFFEFQNDRGRNLSAKKLSRFIADSLRSNKDLKDAIGQVEQSISEFSVKSQVKDDYALLLVRLEPSS